MPLDFSPRIAFHKKEGVTQSELGTLDTCPMKWNLYYNNLLALRGAWDWSLAVGTAWHAFQEEWRKSKGVCNVTKFRMPEIGPEVVRDSDFELKLDYWTNVLPVMQQVYSVIAKDERLINYDIIEEELETEFMGFRLRGKIDLAWGNKIRDFKTTSSSWFYTSEGWEIKFQFLFYSWLIKRVRGVKGTIYFQKDTLQKPLLKIKKDEARTAFIARIKADIVARPDFYFLKETFEYSEERIKHWEETVLVPKLTKMALMDEHPVLAVDKITDSCSKYGKLCAFFNICKGSLDDAGIFFEQKTKKHSELDNE